MWQPIVNCEHCGRQHQTTRVVALPCTFPMICHDCEAELLVTIPRAALIRDGAPGRELIALPIVGVARERSPRHTIR